MIKTKPDISIYMTSRIVHSYFSRIRHIIRQFRHFVFRIGSYETDKACNSAISLRVAAKTRTKPTGAPSTVYRTNMPRVADSMRYFRDLFAKQTPTLLSWPTCTSMDLMLIITPLETNARTLITTKYRRALPPQWERVGTKPPARLQLLREDPCVMKDSAFRAKYADIFEKQTTILSWTWRIYGIQHVKVHIRTNKPLNVLVRLRLSFSVSLMD